MKEEENPFSTYPSIFTSLSCRVFCPGGNNLMRIEKVAGYLSKWIVWCDEPSCSYSGRRFTVILPTVELEEIKE